jgi:hypothetical protein
MEARWQQQTVKHEGTENRARSKGSNPRLDSFWFSNPIITLAAVRARGNEINTARWSNALLTFRLAVF